MDISVSLYLTSDSESDRLAAASITLNGQFVVKGISVRNGRYGKWITMPSILVNGAGKREYRAAAYAWNRTLGKEIKAQILSAYEKAMEDEEEAYADAASTVRELPFKAAVTPLSGGHGTLAKASIILDNQFVIEDIWLKQTWDKRKMYLCFPSYTKQDGSRGEYCYPITAEFREVLIQGILKEYQKELEKQAPTNFE